MNGDFLQAFRPAFTAWVVGALMMVCGSSQARAQASGDEDSELTLADLTARKKAELSGWLKDTGEPPEKLVLRAVEVGSKDKAECEMLLQRAGLKKYPPALFNLYVGNCFGYFRTGMVVDGDPPAAARYRKQWLEADGSSAALQAIGEGYLAGIVLVRRESLVSLTARDQMGLGRTVSTPGGVAYAPGDRERGVLAVDYEKGLLTMAGGEVTEQFTLSNYRVIFDGAGWLPRNKVPGNLQRLWYGAEVGTACGYFEKAAWKAVKNLKNPQMERSREIRVLKRSLQVLGQYLANHRWKPADSSKVSALAKECAALAESLPAGTIPEEFLAAAGSKSKEASDSDYLESLGIKK